MKTMKKVFATSSIILLDMLALSAEVSGQETAAAIPSNSETLITEKLMEKFATFIDQSTTVADKNTLTKFGLPNWFVSENLLTLIFSSFVSSRTFKELCQGGRHRGGPALTSF